MKRLLYMPVVLLLFLSISFAQNSLETRQNIESGLTPLMSKVLNLLIVKAKTFDLTEEQMKRLNLVQEKYVFPLAEKEAENNISRMMVIKIIQEPDFDPAEAKKASEKLKQTALEMSYTLIDGLVEIREIIGLENYSIITSRVKIH
ncbi:MAG: hypothetical protein DHS20C13_21990 [Thermodesulfobacteriota bacterium]|nr:MAG: hypothetical protein DHS20C13_21990 [Thermodesulfobacteriota bacterium]